MADSRRDLDFGPEWLRTELPQPVASAWHRAVEYPGGDHQTVAIAVEVALRFVTALQVANLLAQRRPLPAAVTRGLETPNMAALITATRESRDALKGDAFLSELARWPDREVEALLEEFKPFRNLLSHEDMSPAERVALGSKLLDAAVRIMGSLDWLRRVELVSFVEIRPERGPLREGRVQVLRGHDDEPRSERRAWRGDPIEGRFYLVSSDAHEERLLDLDPFVRRAMLSDSDEIRLWLGFKNNEVRFADKRRTRFEGLPLREVMGDPRYVHCEWMSLGVDPVGPTQPDQPLRLPAGPSVSKRSRGFLMAFGGLMFLGACVAAIVVTSRDTDASAEASGEAEAKPKVLEREPVPAGGLGEGNVSRGTSAATEDPFAEHQFLSGFVDRFCRGTASEEDIATLEMLAKNRAVSPRALIAVFNVVGAFYRHEFTKELWLNDLYYGAGAVHLPASCRAMIGAYRTAGEVPGHLLRVRDRVNRIWKSVR